MRIVCFTQRVEIVESYGERRDCADQRIAEFIAACGYLPIPVPNNAGMVQHLIANLEPAGIILTGGNSLVKYGGNAPERDAMDMALIDIVCEHKIPLYGFCRGMQSILDYWGNPLTNVEGHVAVRHKVFGGSADIEVNSYHNQACLKILSPEIIAVMKTEDGVIEMIRHRELPFTAVMWHPEREKIFSEFDIKCVRDLFK